METTEMHAARLKEKANEWKFGTACEHRILVHLTQTINNQAL